MTKDQVTLKGKFGLETNGSRWHIAVMLSRITSDPRICHGKPCFKGTRILVSTVLESLADGDSIATLVREYPPLKRQDIFKAIEYAALLARGEDHCLNRKVV